MADTFHSTVLQASLFPELSIQVNFFQQCYKTKDTRNGWQQIQALGLEDSHDKLRNETTEMLTIQACDVISHSIKLDVSVGVPLLPLIQNFSRFSQCQNHQAKCYSRLQQFPCFEGSAQTGNHPVSEDSARSQKSTHTQVQDLRDGSRCFSQAQAASEVNEQLFPQRRTTMQYMCVCVHIHAHTQMHRYITQYMYVGVKKICESDKYI